MREVIRSGWGRNITAPVHYRNLERYSNFHNIGSSSGLTVGLGRSYGDSSLNDTGITWSTKHLNHVEISAITSEATCGAGVTIGELERASEKHGLFPPVVPGTEFVTIGGAIASNIHGKSHHSFGSFCDNVLEIEILDAEGKITKLFPYGESSELFWATVGGMGLTGAILSARIKLISVTSPFLTVQEERVSNLDEMFELTTVMDANYLYTVAWIDLSGKYLGRGLVSGGNHVLRHEFNLMKARTPRTLRSREFPLIPAINYINRYTVRGFNEIWYQKPLKSGLVHYRPFLHPLDGVANWNRVYGPRGFIQYQFVVPFDQQDFIYSVLSEMRKIGAASFLGVLKKFGPSRSRFLSFPKPGWTLAIDIPSGLSKLIETLDRLDGELTQIGGRVYLSKDSRLSIDNFHKMYPEYEKWRQFKTQMDPENYWQSVQGRRLGLC